MMAFIIITALIAWMASRKFSAIDKETAEKLKGENLSREDKKNIKQQAAKKRHTVLVWTLIIIIGMLVVFKIFNYFSAAVGMLVGMLAGTEKADAFRLVMPLGISYYTFATLGYLLDVYWKRYEAETNFARFFLFAIYYPHILQGPISRYPLLGQELKKPELRFRWDNFVVGMESILLGCFKKLVIADRLSVYVSQTMQVPKLGGAVYLLALIFDALQIYTDFSGYTDIVRGISKLFDVELEQNFNHPFFAKSVPEFWRRWHMSLGSWFKDYVYYPISMSKTVKNINKKTKNWKSSHMRNIALVIIPVMVTWLLTGLWHGTGYGYVAWGIYYGVLIGLSVTFSEDIANILVKLNVNTECFSYRFFQTLKIFGIFMGGRFLGSTMEFRQRLRIGYAILTRFFDFTIFKYGLSGADFVIIAIGVLILVAIGVIEAKENIFSWFNRQNKIFCAIVIWAMFFAVFLLGVYGSGYDTSNFMYQQF